MKRKRATGHNLVATQRYTCSVAMEKGRVGRWWGPFSRLVGEPRLHSALLAASLLLSLSTDPSVGRANLPADRCDRRGCLANRHAAPAGPAAHPAKRARAHHGAGFSDPGIHPTNPLADHGDRSGCPVCRGGRLYDSRGQRNWLQGRLDTGPQARCPQRLSWMSTGVALSPHCARTPLCRESPTENVGEGRKFLSRYRSRGVTGERARTGASWNSNEFNKIVPDWVKARTRNYVWFWPHVKILLFPNSPALSPAPGFARSRDAFVGRYLGTNSHGFTYPRRNAWETAFSSATSKAAIPDPSQRGCPWFAEIPRRGRLRNSPLPIFSPHQAGSHMSVPDTGTRTRAVECPCRG